MLVHSDRDDDETESTLGLLGGGGGEVDRSCDPGHVLVWMQTPSCTTLSIGQAHRSTLKRGWIGFGISHVASSGGADVVNSWPLEHTTGGEVGRGGVGGGGDGVGGGGGGSVGDGDGGGDGSGEGGGGGDGAATSDMEKDGFQPS